MQAIPIFIIMMLLLAASRWSDDFDHGASAYEAGRYSQAIEYFTKSLETGDLSSANRARALNNRAVSLDREGRYAEALRDFDAAIRLAPADMELFRNRGAVVSHAGDAGPPAAQAGPSLRIQDKIRRFWVL